MSYPIILITVSLTTNKYSSGLSVHDLDIFIIICYLVNEGKNHILDGSSGGRPAVSHTGNPYLHQPNIL